MRPHPEQELLVGLAGAVDTHVRRRRCRQHPAQGIERFGANGQPVDAFGLGWIVRELRLVKRAYLRQPRAVDVEPSVERDDVALAKLAVKLRGDVVAVAAAWP